MDELFNNQQKFDHYVKILIIVSAFSVTISALIVNFTSANHEFTPSIYEQLPWYFWFLIVIGTLIGELTLVSSAFHKGKSKLWIVGLLTILLMNILLLFLTDVLDYLCIGRGDSLSHIGYTKDIDYFGSPNELDLYPAMHILLFTFGKITSINIFQSGMFMPKYFTLFFFISLFVLGFKIFKDRLQYLLFLAFGSLLLFNFAHLQFTPYWESLFIIPMFVLLVFKCSSSKGKRFGVLLFIFLTLFAHSHPIIALFTVAFLILYDLYNYFFAKHNWDSFSSSVIIYALFAFILFFQYNFEFRIVKKNLKLVYQSIVSELGGVNEVQEGLTKAAEAGLDYLELIRIIFFTHGTYVLFATVTTLCLCYVFYQSLRGIQIDKGIAFFGITAFIMYSLAAIGSISFVLFGVSRLYRIGHIFALIFIPAVFAMFFMQRQKSCSRSAGLPLILVLAFVLILVVLSVFTLYPSPIAGQQNEQVTKANLVGLQTFFNHSNQLDIIEYRSRSARFYHAIYGMESAKQNSMLGYKETFPIEHFGYDMHNSSLNQVYHKNVYFIDQRLQNFLRTSPEEIRGFNPSDMVLLNNDHSVIRWYDNAEIRAYLIYG